MKRGLGIQNSGFGRTFILVLCLSTLVACSRTTPPVADALFPNGTEAPGWVKTSDARTFTADDLWKYIDGDAERFIRAGVRKTITTDYRYREKIEATVDIHVMSNPDGARKIFESESSQGSEPLALGEAGRISQGTLAFRKGPYFVRLVAYQEAPEVSEALTSLARAIAPRLGESAIRN